MSKRKVTFEDGNGEFDLEDDVPNKKVMLSSLHGYLKSIDCCGGIG